MKSPSWRSTSLACALVTAGAVQAQAAQAPSIESMLSSHAFGVPGPKKGGVIPLCVPIDIAIDAADELYVGNHYAASGCGPVSQITVYSKTDQPQATKTITTGITNAAGLGFDSKGYLYVADYATQQVEVYNSKGKPEARKTLKTDPNYNPSGVEVAKNGTIWVANRTNGNIGIGEIQIFTRAGKVKTTVTQNLVYPIGIAFAPGSGDAWVGNSETPNDALSEYTPRGKPIKVIPTPGFTPTYVAFAPNGNLYATDALHNAVEIFDGSGAQVGGTITAGLSSPYGIAINSKGDFYVANIGSGGVNNGSTITKYTASGVLLCTISGTDGCK